MTNKPGDSLEGRTKKGSGQDAEIMPPIPGIHSPPLKVPGCCREYSSSTVPSRLFIAPVVTLPPDTA